MEENPNEVLQDVIELVDQTPNDQELGKAIRELLRKFLQK